jgi:hypothetical protein
MVSTPPVSDDPDQRAILARRRILVSAAAAAMACSVPEERLVEKVGARVPLPDWEVFNARIPPYSVDPRVPADERGPLESFAALVGPVYAKLRNAQQALDGAWNNPSDRGLVGEVTRLLTGLKDSTSSIVPLCGDGAFTRTWVVLRRGVHVRFLKEQIRLLEAHYATVSAGDQLVISAMACLTCVAEEPFPRDFIGYAPGEVTCPPSADSMASVFKEQEPSTLILVSGHAGSEEPEAEELSKRRAEAVRKRLIERGIEPSRLRVRAMADAVPLNARGAAQNRRVDFERRISLDLP